VLKPFVSFSLGKKKKVSVSFDLLTILLQDLEDGEILSAFLNEVEVFHVVSLEFQILHHGLLGSSLTLARHLPQTLSSHVVKEGLVIGRVFGGAAFCLSRHVLSLCFCNSTTFFTPMRSKQTRSFFFSSALEKKTCPLSSTH
jgi:hypothetical protein